VRARIIHVTVLSGTRATSEQRLDVEQLAIGRGTDNQLRIPGASVPLHHSVLEGRGDGLRLRLVEAREVDLRGQQTAGGSLVPGDVLRIGQHRIEVMPPAPDEDVTLRVEQIEAPPLEHLAQRSRLGIERGLLTRGALSWAGALALGTILLAVPLLSRSPGGATAPLPAALRREADRIVSVAWTTGPLSRVHANLAGDCAACHATPFGLVRDAECRHCHASTGGHAGTGVHADALAATRCATCHPEHHGDAVAGVVEDAQCVACHRDLGAVHAGTGLRNASAFATDHPEFRPSVVTALDSRATRRVPLDAAGLREQSGLTFSHRKHLKKDLRSPRGTVTLDCQSCHAPDAEGALMRLVTFRDHCQGCHPLAFVDGDPTRQVPHAEPAAVQADVYEFFSGRALAGAVADVPGLPRRQPGKDLTEAERLQAVAWARRRSDATLADMFGEKGVCALCHALDRTGDPARVLPVSLLAPDPVHRWLSLSGFSHRPHAAVACVKCHAAADADASDAVMLPGIARCRECHAPTAASATRALSDCRVCHEFHFCGTPGDAAPPRIATGYEELCR
jgi:hypothetical protein